MKKFLQFAIPVIALVLTLNVAFDVIDYTDYAAANRIKQYSNDSYYVDLEAAKHEKEVMEAYENMTPTERMQGVVYE